MVIGSIAAISVMVWFYYTANGRNPVHWALAGFLIYFIVCLLWTVGINPAIKDAAMHTRSTLLMWLARYAYIVVAVACAVFYNLFFGHKKSDH